jgi:oleandomycin transport system permease protein
MSVDIAVAPDATPSTPTADRHGSLSTITTELTESRIPRNLRHALVVARRNLIKTMRTPEQLIDVTIQPIIFLLMFTYVFGGAISGGSQHDYLQFLLPGLLGQSIAMGSVSLGQNLNADIEKGVFDRFRSLPIARSVPLVGAVLADFFRYLLLCVISLGFGYVMGFRIQTNAMDAVLAIVVSIAFALCFCWISVWVGMKARTSGSVQGIMFLIVLPLSFASSTFVKVSTMPGPLQAFVKVNPISHLVGTTRGLMLGGPIETNLIWTLGWMVGLLVVFVPLALRGYNRRA